MMRRGAFVAVLLQLTILCAAGAGAADPVNIDVVLPATGPGAFVGKAEISALSALETLTNQTGGIRGRPVHFVIHDDQTNPAVAVQLTNQVIAEKAPVILGSSLAGLCLAMTPLVRDGPVQYCFTPSISPTPGSYVFSGSISSKDLIETGIQYFRELGRTRIGLITSTDASGQDAERAVDDLLKLPVNQTVTIVDREHFNPSDISVTAQMTRLKASGAQVIFAWTTGSPAGTLFRGANDVGLDLPYFTNTSILTYAQISQYTSFLPKELYFPGPAFLAPEVITDRHLRSVVEAYFTGLNAIGVRPDYVPSTAWDPALITVDALRKLGPNATAAQLRAYLMTLKGFAGVNGYYDFRAYPQRGLGHESALIVKWDAVKGTWFGVSKLGGTPLAKTSQPK